MISLRVSLLSLDLSVLLSSVLPSFSGSTFGKTALDLCLHFLVAPVQVLGVHSDRTSPTMCPRWREGLLLLLDLDGTPDSYWWGCRLLPKHLV